MTIAATPPDHAPGPAILADGLVSFSVWAPEAARVQVHVDGTRHPLTRHPDGTFSGAAPGGAGSRYGFVLGDDPRVLPDPASHFQPDGVDGLSEVIDHRQFAWSDRTWRGHPIDRQVIYELHCGTFTPAGTWRAAIAHLPALARLGVTTLQVMPVNTFAGHFGWGYDGVFWYAPHPAYGRPDDFRAFVDAAHRLELAVILDVVYNHVGPRGSVLRDFSAHYFSRDLTSEWGDTLNYDGEDAAHVRRFVADNAAYWMREFHLDGLRLDATQEIHDTSPVHVVTEALCAARAEAHHSRPVFVAENEPQDARLLHDPERKGCAVDLIYNDDFHHAARVRLTGWRDAYFSDYEGTAHEWLACLRFGFLFQGQYYAWQQKRRGSSTIGVPPHRFLCALENHDQVANADHRGRRLHQVVSSQQLRALTALLLLGPWTPMLFQGQEYGATTPWLYFADHPGELAAQVRQGRQQFMEQFRRVRDPGHASEASPPAEAVPDASASERSFTRCQLQRPDEGVDSTPTWRLHADLLRLRRDWSHRRLRLEASAPDADLLLVHVWRATDEYLLAVNLGADRDLARLSDPLVAPAAPDRVWRLAWSSEAPAYGGGGAPAPEPDRWIAAGHAATVLHAGASKEASA